MRMLVATADNCRGIAESGREHVPEQLLLVSQPRKHRKCIAGSHSQGMRKLGSGRNKSEQVRR
jgi:hypothetical protein